MSFDLNNPLITPLTPANISRGNCLMVAANPQIEYNNNGLGFALAAKSVLETTGKRGAK